MSLDGVVTSELWYELKALQQAAKSLGATTEITALQNVPRVSGIGKR